MTVLLSLSEALADAEVFTDGDWVESKDQDPSGDVRLTQLADVGDGNWIDKSARFLTSAKAKALRCTYLKPGDVLVARMPDPLGRCCIFPGNQMPCVTVVDVCVIRPNLAKIAPRYLMHAINSPMGRRGIERHITGTTRQRISRKNLGKVQIPLPPLAEQKRIAGILDAADALRAKRRDAIAQLDTLLQSTFLDMFGDPVINLMGWEEKLLAEVLQPDRPIAYGILKPGEYEEGGVMMLRIQDIRGGKVAAEGLHRVSQSLSAQYKRTLLSGGEIVVSLVGTIGLCALVPPHFAGANVHRNLAVLVPCDELQPRFLLQYMVSDQFQRRIKETTKGGNQGLLNLGDLKRLPIPIPPLDLQCRFSTIVESVEQQKARMRTHLTELDALFASLQSRAFNGELSGTRSSELGTRSE
ncbi:restriction endonuclease subunit S [Leptothoe sp. PORK10 BA2]|uniref:restriction endonuclease subunit S n=1 Tax=Leptothoe sp. PORK10 BA2 TaxID=3110254 RepID=UPI002B21AADD|nr:restriction endonuclease subunit S [Leptothoe sp. PORK10 BA2]MEA5465283.1 restriction endonuclease subunit S [Leptothoe sp. PORK10 BA2]